jgi:hypothetical protein
MFVGSIEPRRAGSRQTGKTFFQGQCRARLARLYDLHAEDCVRTAEKVDNPSHRAMLLKTAAEWRQAAQAQRQSQKQRPSQELQAPAPKGPGRGR